MHEQLSRVLGSASQAPRLALRHAVVVAAVVAGLGPVAQSSADAVRSLDATLAPSPNGLTIYDATTGVTWLADADLAASHRFGLPVCPAAAGEACVNPAGSMNYQSALAWVEAMRSADYLGHADWQLPTTPNSEPRSRTICPRIGPKPYRNQFGFNCVDNGLGSLFYTDLGLSAPGTAVPVPPNTVGPFRNFQPYLYWSRTPGAGGHGTFSFGNGFKGANTDYNFLYVLPMVPGKIPGTPPATGNGLEVNPGGQTVYDPLTGVTWLADANLASSNTFGLPRCKNPTSPAICVDVDGAMTWATAQQFVKNMRTYHGTGYLGAKHWVLPPASKDCPEYDCTGDMDPMGELFYDHLGLSEGTPVVASPDIAVGPFNHVQPYLYWSCEAATIQGPCQTEGAAPGFEWSFSFGDGFLGTDVLANDLYVTAYYVAPNAPSTPPRTTPTTRPMPCGTHCA
ncbi:MAG: hypothetical protein ACLQVK_20635 [Acidimicrobiales bacterium]